MIKHFFFSRFFRSLKKVKAPLLYVVIYFRCSAIKDL